VAYVLRYHPKIVDEDLPKMPANIRERLVLSLETRLATNPERYGAPLRGPLRGYWKLRVGDYRAVFRIGGNEVWILAILHRSRVYESAANAPGGHRGRQRSTTPHSLAGSGSVGGSSPARI
jgi:mRNA interferase RelE/StbE